MSGINYVIKVTNWVVMVFVLLFQLQFISQVIEASHYGSAHAATQHQPPYGDITFEDNEQSYGNSFDERYRGRLAAGNTKRYPADYATPTSSMGRRRTEREKANYQNVNENYRNANNNNNNNNNMPSRNHNWLATSNMIEEQKQQQQQQQNANYTKDLAEYAVEHKCRIWVPLDALDKYPDAERKQDNKIAGSVYIEICCMGYTAMRWRGKTLCRPLCDNCQNGRCIQPDVCECYEEFVANDNGDCVFSCPLGCQNGRCFLDGSCKCDPGYKLDESRKFCRPICSKGCGNNRLHNCTEPEVCGCVKGYLLTDNDCQPVCQPDCGLGGVCRRPNVCECNPGFTLKDGVCQANCYQKCDNGMCYSPNRCICNPGFTYHERFSQCIPK